MTPAQKDLILMAALLEGKKPGDFVADTLMHAARQVVDRHEIRVLRNRDRDAFVQALLDPPDPSPRLQMAAQRYRQLREQG